MRRLLTGLLAAALLAGAIGVALQSSAQAGGSTRIDVIFDDAHGLIAGQLLQIAGARAGTIHDVKVTPDFKARVELDVDAQYAPFHTDAQCTIRPQGLIAENYVNCDPGTPDAPALRAQGDQPPTVPVSHTTAPVPVTDLFDIWNAPTHERLALLVNELGIAGAGRGQDINDVLRRTNPSLQMARKVIAILERQRHDLATTLDHADTIIGGLAQHTKTFQSFIEESARTAAQTGSHSTQLAEAIHRLPALLDAANPALRDLDTVATAGTPLVRSLRRSAPTLNRLSADLHPFALQVQPTLKKLGPVLDQGIATLTKSIPVSRLLRSYAHNSLPAAQLAGQMFTNLRDRGFVENLLLVFYYGAAATARFDSISHVLPAYLTLNQCALSSSTPVAGCDARFTKTNAAQQTARHGDAQAPKGSATKPSPPGAAPVPQLPVQTPKLPVLGGNPVGAVTQAIDSLLAPITGGGGRSDDDNAIKHLLGYLLK